MQKEKESISLGTMGGCGLGLQKYKFGTGGVI